VGSDGSETIKILMIHLSVSLNVLKASRKSKPSLIVMFKSRRMTPGINSLFSVFTNKKSYTTWASVLLKYSS
jgi:hypothetical protein